MGGEILCYKQTQCLNINFTYNIYYNSSEDYMFSSHVFRNTLLQLLDCIWKNFTDIRASLAVDSRGFIKAECSLPQPCVRFII